ncbi:hypothetical protein [Rubrivirga marina]|nr:hypothetical protein [Rubrivirga marina]
MFASARSMKLPGVWTTNGPPVCSVFGMSVACGRKSDRNRAQPKASPGAR